MADPAAATDDPFAAFPKAIAGASAAAPEADDPNDPFAAFPKAIAEPTSATGAFARGAARSAAPAVGGLAAAGVGAELGAAAGALTGPGAPVAVPVLGFAGGVAGMMLGGAAVAKAQDWALSKLGYDGKQIVADEAQHPIASFLGGVAPYALTMSPLAVAKKTLPENATALQRIMANPATARLFGGTAMGGMELGQEAVEDPQISWPKVAISTGFGVVFNKPTRVGEAITGAVPNLARRAFGRAPTIAQAADVKVMGAGVTEPVFMGSQEQAPVAAMTAQETARAEQSLVGPPSAPSDIHDAARQMHPELFARYDELKAQRDTFAGWVKEAGPDEAPVAAKHLAAIEFEMRQLDPDVGAAYRRAAESTGAATVEAPPKQFSSMAEMLAARGEPVTQPGTVDSTHDVKSGAVSSKDKPGVTYVDPGIPEFSPILKDKDGNPANLHKYLAIHEQTERTAMANGESYLDAHTNKATPAERAAVEADGVDWKKYTEEMDGYLNKIEHEKVTNPPPDPHVDPAAAVGHHQSENKVTEKPAAGLSSVPSTAVGVGASEGVPGPQPAPVDQHAYIADDVEKQLVAAGRSKEEARASAQIISTAYETRAARFKGVLGTAQELYDREGAEIHGPGYRAPRTAQARPGGPAAKPESTWSLLEFLASRGGIDADDPLIADVRGSMGGNNKFVPGFGNLVRKGGMGLDKAREAAVHAGYLFDVGDVTGGESKTDVRTLLDALDKEMRGEKVYARNYAPVEGALDEDEQEHARAGAIEPARELAQHRLNQPPDPLDLAMSGQLSSNVARQIGERIKANQEEIENRIFGDKETADQWRKLHRMSDRAWDNARDADAKKLDQQISDLEVKANLSPEDQSFLNGEGWPDHSDPDAWKELSRNLQDIENGRDDAVRVSASAVRYIPKTNDWSKMDSRSQESVITLLTAMNEEVKNGRDPQKFLKEVFRQRIQRYGGGPDAEEVAQGQMETLANFMKEGIQREGLSTTALLPQELAQGARGKIRPMTGVTSISTTSTLDRPIITLMKDANASTFIHESGHDFLEQMVRDAEHPAAPDDLKGDAKTTLDWLGVKSAAEIKTRQHEKFARGFEQYLREGVAPSKELASVFAKFRQWLVSIYQTLKGLGEPISEDIKGVFDRMLVSDPQRTVIAPERAAGPTMAEIHESDAALTEPHEKHAQGDLVKGEFYRHISEPPPEVTHDIPPALAEVEAARAAAKPAGQTGGDAGAGGQVEPSGGAPEPVTDIGGVGEGRGAERGGGGEPLPGSASARGSASDTAGERSPSAETAQPHPLGPTPAKVFGSRESPFVDKAGNIRVENLTSREDVAQAIHAAADANDNFIGDRRGVVTDGQVLDLAEALGMDAAKLNTRKIGQAFNAEQIVAARQLLIQSATDVAELMKRAADGDDHDVMAYAEAKDRHQMIQAQVAGITAEAGRALRAFRTLAGQEDVQGVDQFIRAATGKTLFQLKEEAKLGSALQSPEQVSKFTADALAGKRTFGRMILEYWINGLISGPATHTTYMVGNTILSLEKVGPETALASLIGRMRTAMGREGETVRMGEVGAQLRGIGMAPALKAAAEAFRTGVTTLLPGEGTNQATLPFQPGSELARPAELDEAARYHDAFGAAFGIVRGLRDGILAGGALLKAGGVEGSPLIGTQQSHLGVIPDITLKGVNVLPLGTAIRLPGRFIAGIHSFFRSVNYSMAKAGGAYRAAANEGLAGTAFDARVADIRQNPSESQMEEWRSSATDLTLMGKGSPFVQSLSRLTNTEILGFPILKFIDPFVHIAGNIIDQSIVQRTPLGLLAPEIRADLMGKNGNIAQDMATARMLAGTGIAVAFGSLAAEGLISGSGPSDPKQSAVWRLAGNQAHSVRINDTWYAVNKLGPMGMLLGLSADMYDVAHTAESGEYLQAASMLQHAVTQNILDESFMRGPAELIQALEDPGRYGEAYLKNFLSSFVPYSVAMSQIDRATDPYARQARTVLDAIRQKVPGLSEQLLPRRDIWGEEIPNMEALGHAGVTAIYERRMSTDPVNLAMLNLGIYPAQIPRKIRNVELTDDQYDEFSRIAGRMSKQRLDAIVRSADYQTWPNHIRHDVIAETITQSREAARGMMMMKYPSIPHDATQIKLDKMQGQDK